MGNDQSRSSKGGQEAVEGPLDYYELLQVDIEATSDEIRKSYRKLALVHHPDKNPHRVEEATKYFADLQQAFEILSDPNERAFYDKHRNDHIETNDDDFYDHVRAGDAATSDPKSKLNRRRAGDPGVKLEQLMRFFDPKLARRMDDTNEGFYSVYRTLFSVLASDEVLHTPEGQVAVDYPLFGDSTTPYAPPAGMSKAERSQTLWARDFYTAWGEFATEKRFEWLEKWDTMRGEDRNIRRLMERENKKLREDHRKEYIETVRTLVQFVQHRDPRYKAYQVQLAQAKKAKKAAGVTGTGASSPGGKHAAVDPKLAKRRLEEREAAAAAYQEQDWQRPTKPDEEEEEEEEPEEQGDGTGIRMDDGTGGENFECVACNKVFQSEASWNNHERSKKHKQAVFRLKKEMRAEGIDFSDDDFVTPAETPLEQDCDELDEEELMDDLEVLEEMEAIEAEQVSLEEAIKQTSQRPESPAPLSPPQPKNKKKTTAAPLVDATDGDVESEGVSTAAVETESNAPELSKREKRRAREAKKAAEEEAAKLAAKEARKEAKKAAKAGVPLPSSVGPSAPKGKAAAHDAFVHPKGKGKKGAKGGKVEKVVVTAEDVDRAVADIQALRQKMVDKWGEDWTSLVGRVARIFAVEGSTTVPELAVLCLGLGRPFGDRTAKIQLALILELTVALGAPVSVIEAFDPVFEDGDRQVLEALGCAVITDNLRGAHAVHETRPHLVYMPHCSKALYESFFTANYTPRLASSTHPVLLLGNDLAEYLPGFSRAHLAGETSNPTSGAATPTTDAGTGDEFVKPKKKRKGRNAPERQFEDTVLRRLVPNFDVLMLSEALPETNLPGFARAFLSTGFQWLTAEKAEGSVDWERALPAVVWPDDGEVA